MTTNPIVRNGWKIYYHPLFNTQYSEIRERVLKLKEDLTDDEFKSHQTVKIFAALVRGIEELIPNDPFASHFALTGTLKKYGRMKKMGLNDRYRLFFKAFKSQDETEEGVIVILWLGYPRKEGDKKDCYNVFEKMVASGKFPDTSQELLASF